MTGRAIKTSPDETPTPCHPSAKNTGCWQCQRFRSTPALPSEQRAYLVIDASITVRDGNCPMHLERPALSRAA